MRFSIVTISFNQGQYLEQAIRSVLSQSEDVEYIIVDPGSNDGSRDIINRYGSRIKVIYGPDRGPADGLNKGFMLATGDVFGYINADDFYLSGCLARVNKAFQTYADVDIIYGHGYICDGQNKMIRHFRSDTFSLSSYSFGAGIVMQQSTFFRRGAWLRTSGFNIHNRTSWDGELMVDFARAGLKMRRVNEYWSVFRIHPESITGSQNIKDQCKLDMAMVIKKIRGRDDAGIEKMMQLLILRERIFKWMRDPITPLLRMWDILSINRKKIEPV